MLARSDTGTVTLTFSSISKTFTDCCLPYCQTARSLTQSWLIWTWIRSALLDSTAAVKDCSFNRIKYIWGEKSASSSSTGRFGVVIEGSERRWPELWCRCSINSLKGTRYCYIRSRTHVNQVKLNALKDLGRNYILQRAFGFAGSFLMTDFT